MFKLIVKAQIEQPDRNGHGMPLDIQAEDDNKIHLSCGSFSITIPVEVLLAAIEKVRQHHALDEEKPTSTELLRSMVE